MNLHRCVYYPMHDGILKLCRETYRENNWGNIL